jgi:hypothetical protein
MTDLPNDPASLTTKGQAVLEAIWSIGGDMALAIGQRRRVPTPDAKGLYALCNVLAEDPSEERLQCLLEEHPGFITGLLGGPDNVDLAVLFKPPVGFQYKADFCVLQAHQGGAVAWLIEIETAHENLFTRIGNPARRLAHPLKQIEDWKIWIEREPLPYARELVRLAKTMRTLDDHLPGRQGFRLCEPEQLERLWEGFGGFEQPLFRYVLIIGRWSRLADSEKARIINRNRQDAGPVRIYTFEQLARGANFRLERDDWFNSHSD